MDCNVIEGINSIKSCKIWPTLFADSLPSDCKILQLDNCFRVRREGGGKVPVLYTGALHKAFLCFTLTILRQKKKKSKIWNIEYKRDTMQHLKKKIFCPQKVDKTSLKEIPSTFFHNELPKRPKKKNSCSKIWLLDKLYIKLGEKYYFTNTLGDT